MAIKPGKWIAHVAALIGLVCGVSYFSPWAGQGAPRVVVSVRPLHALVAGVMKGVGVPHLLVRGAASPHTYSLRPSDARALGRADVVIWVGEAFETFLRKPLKVLSTKARVIEFAKTGRLTRLVVRKGGAWGRRDDSDHAREAQPGRKEGRGGMHRTGPFDPHVWLDPVNARAMVREIVETLGRADPRRARRYQENGRTMVRRLQALDEEIRSRLGPVAGVPYIVFHDAYRYFEDRYGLNVAGSLTVSPERRPGARRVSEIRARVRRLGVVCVFAEPQFRLSLVRTVVAGTGVRAAVLDPLGADLEAGPEQYFALMRRLTDSLVRCLIGNRG